MMRRSTSSTSLDNSSLSAVSVFCLDSQVVWRNFVTTGNVILQGVVLSALLRAKSIPTMKRSIFS